LSDNIFICPICKSHLAENNHTFICDNNHCYDISKQGYVNLLRSQKSSKKRHGDDKLMLQCRHDFLERGFYKPLLDEIANVVNQKSCTKPITILDVGCGEGYYTANIHTAVENSIVYGIDISKDALIYALKRDKELRLAAASCSELPVQTESCDVVMNIFSPTNADEYARVLKHDGILIRAVPLENHLFGLKSAVYDKPYKNKTENPQLDHFTAKDIKEIKYTWRFTTNEDIVSLFKMTPYYYKTSRTDQAKLNSLNELETEIAFGLIVYKKA